MDRAYSNLLTPIKIGDVVFRNRIFTAPMTLHALQAREPYPTEAVITHFANKAKGGAACVTCSGVSIVNMANDGMHASWDIYQPNSLNYLAQLADRIHFYGAKASMELGGGGMTGGDYAVSDGVIMINGQPGHEMPEEEIERLSDCYANAAESVKDAGFDMILLHFGHGLQVGQFLSPLTNKRKDKFGGSLENRARFPIMIIDRIREKVGRKLLIEVRISGAEFEPGGIQTEEAIEFTKMIEDKIDIIHVSAGMHHPKWMTVTNPSDFLPHAPNIFLAEKVKKSGVKIPVAAIGAIQNLEEADGIIADGRADIVLVARGFIADPMLGEKAYENRGNDVVPCIKCLRCHDSDVFGHKFVCSVNPEIGFEHKIDQMITQAKRKKKVAVVGGGPAGMEAALIAAQRGHEVTLYEKSNSLGGALRFSDFVDFKYSLKSYKDYLVRQVEKSSIKVKLNTEAKPDMLENSSTDVIFAALGADPMVPPIPGIEGQNVVMALDTYGNEDKLGKKVIVIGGGEVGCETALHLARMDKNVVILEMQDELAPDASPTHRTELIMELEKNQKLSFVTASRCTEINSSGVIYTSKSGEKKSISADNIIVAAGMKPKADEAIRFGSCSGRFEAVGDCVNASNVERAIKSAYCSASQI